MTTKRGLTYPLTLSADGGLSLSEDSDRTFENILSTLSTKPSERVMRPRLGTPDYVFESVSNSAFIPSRIEAALTEQVSDPDRFTVLGSYDESGVFRVDVNYTLGAIAQPPIQFKLKA